MQPRSPPKTRNWQLETVFMIKAVRGTRDLLPPDTDLWNRVDAKVRELFARYNYHEIRTPIFEDTQLFSRSVGEDTDIVSKEMFTWEDGAEPADYALYEEWLTRRYPGIDALHRIGPDFLQRRVFGPTLRIFEKGRRNATIVGFRHRVTLQHLDQLIEARERYAGTPGGGPRILVVTLPGAVSQRLRSFATKENVELEEMPLDSFDPPQSLTLRPENTAGVVRAYIEHGLYKTGTLQKLYYIGPQFRRERPQKGRYRQFFQIGAEIIGPPSAGSESPLRDAELLEMLATLLDEVGLRSWQLQLNSVGCADDRARYNKALREALQPVVHQMCADCQRRAETNPLRVL